MAEVNEYVPTIVMDRTAAREAIAQERRISAVAMESASQGARVASLEATMRSMSKEVSGTFAAVDLLRKEHEHAVISGIAARDEFDLVIERHHRRERIALAIIIGLLVLHIWPK